MHTNTFQSRFKAGDKITNGKQTITVGRLGLDTRDGVYYREHEGVVLYYEKDLTNFHLVPRYSIGERVWRCNWNGIVEDIIESFDGTHYLTKNSLSRYTEDQLFPTAESCRTGIKVVPLSQ